MIFIISIGIANVNYAATVTVDTAMYDKDMTVLIDEDNPKSSPNVVLPKTGGIPGEAFYVLGALIVAAGVLVSKRKVKAASTGYKK